MDTNRLLMLAGAGAGGYYLLGKKPIGALVGVAVLMLLTQSGMRPLNQVMPSAEPVGPPESTLGAPVASGLPAPGTTSDPLGGVVSPNSGKRIGLLR